MIALAAASLSMPDQPRFSEQATALVDELVRQILPDGGHVSRNPGAILELLVDLLPLRQAFAARGVAPPRILLSAIDRMMPMLRFFRQGDGSFAHFNGMGETPPTCSPPCSPMTTCAARRSPTRRTRGYQRFEAGGTADPDGHRPAAADRLEPGGACRLPVLRDVAPRASA